MKYFPSAGVRCRFHGLCRLRAAHEAACGRQIKRGVWFHALYDGEIAKNIMIKRWGPTPHPNQPPLLVCRSLGGGSLLLAVVSSLIAIFLVLLAPESPTCTDMTVRPTWRFLPAVRNSREGHRAEDMNPD